LTLTAKGIIPSLKNNKVLIARGRNGKPLPRPLLITKPEYKEKMEKITESFRLQLLSAFRTESGETLTGCSLLSAIASALPEDDAWTHIPEIHIRAELCEDGEEGCDITIKRIL
jgi:hypothetical protein